MVGPLTFRDSDAPQYIPAKVTIVAVLSLCMIAVLLLDWMYIRENKKRDREQAQNPQEIRDIEFMDLTDKQNRHFRVSDTLLVVGGMLTRSTVLLIGCDGFDESTHASRT